MELDDESLEWMDPSCPVHSKPARGVSSTREPAATDIDAEADRLMTLLHGPLWPASKNPGDVARRLFLREIVKAGFTISRVGESEVSS